MLFWLTDDFRDSQQKRGDQNTPRHQHDWPLEWGDADFSASGRIMGGVIDNHLQNYAITESL